MTLERSYFHKLMLEAGLTESFDQELDELLEKEDPLSELTLALSTCGGNRNEQIHILSTFIWSVPPDQIDYDVVFSFIVDAFERMNKESPDTIGQLVIWMLSIALSSGLASTKPWNDIIVLYLRYTDYQEGLVSELSFTQSFIEFLHYKKGERPPCKLMSE